MQFNSKITLTHVLVSLILSSSSVTVSADQISRFDALCPSVQSLEEFEIRAILRLISTELSEDEYFLFSQFSSFAEMSCEQKQRFIEIVEKSKINSIHLHTVFIS